MPAKLLKVAWWSVGLGLGMELILVAVAAGAGKMPGLQPVLADLVQKVSWSFIVCAGLALGTVATKSPQAVMGLAGFVAAPAAFWIARALHKGAVQALAIAGPVSPPPSALVLAAIKAGEYACLGVAVARLSKRRAGPRSYVTVGLLIGAVTAAVIFALAAAAGAKLALPAVLVRAVNELLFPVGCALVLFGAGAVAGKAK